MTELKKHDHAPTSPAIARADTLFRQQQEWSAEEDGAKLGRLDAAIEIRHTLPTLLREQAEMIQFHPSDTLVGHTVELLDRTLLNSPLPPIRITEFTKQIVTSQASNGEVPLALQEIACLNYMLVTRPVPYGERQDLEILPISNTQPEKRWRRFLDEQRDFALALTEIGVRPVISFGISDVLDFEKATDFSHSAEDLEAAVDQNRQVMMAGIEALNAELASTLLPDPALRPELKTFLHSEILAGSHAAAFSANKEKLSLQPHTILEFREWLFTQFPRIYNRSRQDPNHQNRLTQMLALYATDNQLAVELLRQMFPGQPIDAVTSVSLQPPQVWEWIEEKVGCDLIGVPITQISPFPNAGNWHGKHEPTGTYSIRATHGLQHLTPNAAFIHMMREADTTILPEITPERMSGEDVMKLKTEEVRELMTATYGETKAQEAEAAYRLRKESKQKKPQNV
ncbi:MAG: hypothetical protein RLZZ455_916 [Candidatus Parcubacteria bacterium]|jgi:hypothetical protein